MFSYVDLESRIPRSHPLRRIRRLVDRALTELSSRFDELYASSGRPSIPPERLLRALLLQILFSVRSERQLMEQLDYNLLFRWFVGLGIDDRVWESDDVHEESRPVARRRGCRGFLPSDPCAGKTPRLALEGAFHRRRHADRRLASHKSFRPKDEESPPPDGGADFRGKKRTNDTHQSTTDPQARLSRKGPERKRSSPTAGTSWSRIGTE